jgi:alkyl sulfatase BDS1-like metallo-beta-lactamase superfamily hydrolase
LEEKFDPQAILQGVLKTFAEGDLPAPAILESWRYFVDAEGAGDARLRLGLHLTDTGEKIGFELRNSILEIHSEGWPYEPDAIATLSTATLNRISREEQGFDTNVEVEGDAKALTRFLGYLDREVPAIYMHVR